ncbi:MAG: (Fe-S)-binding protein [Bacteroidetes bacterium]|nr:(Fe-S)-binding protein [Bacteroidota bacterium]
MIKQILFALSLLITIGVFAYTTRKLIALFKLTKPAFVVTDFGKRIAVTLKVAFGQTKIMRRPVIGFMHALVWWGFLVILFGSIEMVIDGLFGTERVLGFLGVVYDVLFASGDVFAFLIAILVAAFLFRRIAMNVKRFSGVEMKHKSHVDANIALTIILILMVTLLGMNTFYILGATSAGHQVVGIYPIASIFAGWFGGMSGETAHLFHEINWWGHILGIFFFANYLPYSKHFHVFMSVPNVFLSNLNPLGKMTNMENITKEVKMMLDPEAAFEEPAEGEEETIERFGVMDVEDVSWKNYMDSLACTQCGRCTSVCPANLTGKLLSPRKIVMNVRERMKEKGPEMIKNGKDWSDNKALLGDYITAEELWACTTCNACAQECPININQPAIILDMRRYIVMEESAAPGELNSIFSNIENNGAPWQFAQDDRMLWADGLTMNSPTK